MSDSITWSGYIVIKVNRRGYERPGLWKASAKLYSGKPTVTRDEVAVKVSVELPVSLFQRPQLEARITVPEHAVTPLEIGLDIRDNIEQLISKSTGFDVKLVPIDGGAA